MTPTVSELLLGNFLSLVDAPPPESMGDFMTGRIGVIGMISMLAAQEAERGAEARVWENLAIREMLGAAAPAYGAKYAVAAAGDEDDLSISALDRENAGLRRALTELHAAVEDAGDSALHHDILRLYVQMADARRLDLPPLPGS